MPRGFFDSRKPRSTVTTVDNPIDRYSGNTYSVVTGPTALDGLIWVKSYRDLFEEYRLHPEPKRADSDGEPGGRQARGLLPSTPSRTPRGFARRDIRAEHDKTGHEQWVRLTQPARRIVLDHLQTVHVEDWLFPSTTKPLQPVNRQTMDRRLIKAYERAKLEHLEQGLWHPWRRKWGTERKGLPVKDVAAAGGWSDTATLLRSYQQSDETTLTQVVLEAPKLTAKGSGGTEVTPFTTPTRPSGESVEGTQGQVG